MKPKNKYASHRTVQHKNLPARIMQIETPHGSITTPTFMPVGTRAFVNHATPQDLTLAHSQIILGGNTYHMLCAPGLETIQALGGMHKMMHWDKPMLTDSGGFQVFSLSKNSKICKISETGARFKHPISGQIIQMTPESSLHAQKIIGADIIMAFDQCTPDSLSERETAKIMTRTHRWLLQSKTYHQANPQSAYGFHQALFGIIQGGCYKKLRQESADFILNADLDGVAIGGESIGFNMEKTAEIIDWIRPDLPTDKARYTMGVGLNPEDLIAVVKLGIDLFDCVAPTRNARHGALYHGLAKLSDDWVTYDTLGEDKGRLLIKKAKYAQQDVPILAGCECYTCQHHSRGYLHYLFKMKSAMYSQLACIHNIHVMQQVCDAMREAINVNAETL